MLAEVVGQGIRSSKFTVHRPICAMPMRTTVSASWASFIPLAYQPAAPPGAHSAAIHAKAPIVVRRRTRVEPAACREPAPATVGFLS
jgi:hypothetical protein